MSELLLFFEFISFNSVYKVINTENAIGNRLVINRSEIIFFLFTKWDIKSRPKKTTKFKINRYCGELRNSKTNWINIVK